MRPFKIISLLLIVCLITAYQPKGKSLSPKAKLPSSWTQLNKSETGYVLYKPCDGSTPTVSIKGLSLIINWQLESEMHKIKNIIQVSDSVIKINCDNSNFIIIIKWLDKERTKALWKFQNIDNNDIFKWVMCPTKFKSQFPFVDNPCPTEKIKEKVFLPIDIE